MKYRRRIYYSSEQRAEIWDRWQRGESLSSIGRRFDRQSSSVFSVISPTGGIRPTDRTRSKQALSLKVAGWLSDPKVLAAGKAIYEGTQNPAVRCALCHGVDGKPTRIGKGAPDFSHASEAEASNDLWFWRISEGVQKTKMMGWKNSLTEEQRWQVIAYIRTLAHKGAH